VSRSKCFGTLVEITFLVVYLISLAMHLILVLVLLCMTCLPPLNKNVCFSYYRTLVLAIAIKKTRLTLK